MKLIDDGLLKEYKSWLLTSDNPDYTGTETYPQYDNYINRLLEKAIELDLITANAINVTDVAWLNKFEQIYYSSQRLKAIDEKVIGHRGGIASLKKFIKFIKFKNKNAIPNNGGNKNMNLQDEHDLNLILYGPPGTGKTYSTVIKAVEIIKGRSAVVTQVNGKEEPKPYDEILKIYRELYKAGRIAFTTFHQSYGYEEFIEGIKPDLEADDLKYKRADGVFKEFCERAKKLKQGIAQQYAISAESNVWKVSLGGVENKTIKKYCFDNDVIRLGWGNSFSAKQAETSEYKGDGKRIFNAFTTGMKKGDIVFSFLTQDSIDAIGVILEDEAKWDDKKFNEYRWCRKVEWFKKGVDIRIKELNGNKSMIQPAVHKLSVTVEDALALINDTKTNDKDDYDYSEPYVFIIDEINRGNVSKIFGELITLIEESKRLGNDEAMTVRLPYSEVPFGVPKNVYILGTMNTADRSLVQLDAALRRRFTFEEMMPRPSLLKTTKDGINLIKMLETINKRITALSDREHQIGHSYFMKLNEQSTVADLQKIFKNKIIPLLQEYFFDDYGLIQLVLGQAFVKEENNPFNSGSKIYTIKCPVDANAYKAIYGDISGNSAQNNG